MQILCEGLDLADAVLKVSKAIAVKTTNPVLEGIKLVAEDDTLTLFSTDLELSIEKKIKAEVKEEGSCVVPGKFFSEYVKKLTNDKIELTLEENNGLKIKYLDSEGYIQCFMESEYPDINLMDSKEYFAITKTNLKELINNVIFSVAIDDSRPILRGCLLEIGKDVIKAVTSDGYRLSLARKVLTYSNTETSCIVPDKSLREISKILDDSDEQINVYVNKNFLMVDQGDTKIITRLLEGEFLNYKQIIMASAKDTVITVNKAQIVDALERASLLSKIGQNNLVKFDIKEDVMLLTSNSEIGNVKEKISIVLEGKDLLIAFNARYFLEAFRTIDDEFVKINFQGPTNPCTITPVDGEKEEYLYLILPVRMINWLTNLVLYFILE